MERSCPGLNSLGLAAASGRWQIEGMTKKKPVKPKKKPNQRAREDNSQTAFRVMQEVIRRSET